MSREDKPDLPLIGSQIQTACGGEEQFSTETPHAMHEGNWIFFCTPDCRQDFVQDPQNSCLVSHTQNEEE
jgi:YHS domain-containing protein